MTTVYSSSAAFRTGVLRDDPVHVRVKISALWVTMLFVFAYVDLFSLYRPTMRADLDVGVVGPFDVGPTFLLGITAYIAIPAVMVALSLMVSAVPLRWLTLVIAGVYVVTIVGGAIGEWSYYIVGSAVEVVCLVTIMWLVWKWPRAVATSPTNDDDAGVNI